MPRPDSLFNKLRSDLHAQITHSFRAGEPLPSERRLAAAHGVAQKTVHRVLCVLAQDGLVRVNPTRGWTRTDPDSEPIDGSSSGISRRMSVGIISRRNKYEIEKNGSKIYPELAAEAQRQGMGVTWALNDDRHRYTPARNRIDFSRIPWNKFDVGLLVEIEDSINLSDPTLKKRRVLAVDQDATRFGLNCVTFDNFGAGQAAARYLFELGHRRMAVMEEITEPEWPSEMTWMKRRHGFESEVGILGGCIRPEWRVPFMRREKPHMKRAAIRAWVANFNHMPGSERPTAFFAVNPSRELDALYEEFQRFDLQIPRDLSVISADWKKSEELPASGRPSLIYLDLPALIRRSIDIARELSTRRPDATPELFTTPVLLIPGNTTAPVCSPSGK